MAPVLSRYIKRRIVNLANLGNRYTKITEILLQEDNFKVSRQAVSNTVTKFRNDNSLSSDRKSGRKRILTHEHLNFIDKSYEENDELTSVDLQKLILKNFGIEFSTAMIRIYQKKLGWTLSGPRYCQLIRVPNQIARYEFCQKLTEANDRLDDVIFTDESTIMLDKHGKIYFRKKGRLGKLKPKPKHPYKVDVWAGISKRGPTEILIFTGIMRNEFYAEILKNGLIPFIEKVYPDGHRFQQDNDPKHKSKILIIF